MAVLVWLGSGVLLLAGGIRLSHRAAESWVRAATRPGLAAGLPSSLLLLSLAGMAASALLHSSSAVSVLTLAWVESGLLSTAQGLAVMLGANVGTTATAQAVSVAGPLPLGPFLLGLTALVWLGRRSRAGASTLLSLAAIVEGVEWLSHGTLLALGHHLRQGTQGLAAVASAPVAFLAGWGVTAVVQSSTLVTSAAVALAGHGALGPREAVSVVLGSNVGTVTTALAASLLLGGRSRRLALADLLMNLVPAALVLVGLNPYLGLLYRIDARPERVAANAHTLFNVLTWLLFWPWVRRLGRWIGSPAHRR